MENLFKLIFKFLIFIWLKLNSLYLYSSKKSSFQYRYVFAIATEDSIYLYDTQNLTPFAFVTGIHYSNLSDLSWSCDGKILNVTSIDGFCSFIIFNEHELGTIFKEQIM